MKAHRSLMGSENICLGYGKVTLAGLRYMHQNTCKKKKNQNIPSNVGERHVRQILLGCLKKVKWGMAESYRGKN